MTVPLFSRKMVPVYFDSLRKRPNNRLNDQPVRLAVLLCVVLLALLAVPAQGSVEFPGPVEQPLLAGPRSAVSVPWNTGNSDFLVVGDDQGFMNFIYHLFLDVNYAVYARYNLGGDILWMQQWLDGPYGQRGLVVATANPDRLHFVEIIYSSPFVRIEQTLELPEDPGSTVFLSPGPNGEAQMALSLPGVDQVLILRQVAGQWLTSQVLDTGDEPWSLAALDLDGDQVLEFVSANRGGLSGTLGVFTQQIDGTYVLSSHVELSGKVHRVLAEDLDLDGSRELIVSYTDFSQLDIMTRETGNWVTLHSLDTLNPGGYSQVVLLPAGDFGIVTSFEDRGLMEFFIFSEGSWILRESYYVGCRPLALAVCDLNGDDINEIACLGSSEHTVTFLLGNTAPGFWGFPAVSLTPNPITSLLADFDGNELSDLVVGTFGPSSLNLYLNDPAGGLSKTPINQEVSFFPTSMAAGNFSGDEKNELVVLDSGNDLLRFFTISNSAGFVADTTLDFSAVSAQLHVADVDNDGYADIYLAQASRQQVDLLFGQGGGSFSEVLTLDLPLGAHEVVAIDLNNDAWLDLVVADGQARVWTMVNLDGRSFASAVPVQANTGTRSLAVVDLDNDSDLDVVVGNFNSETITFLENTGNGILSRRIGGLSLNGHPTSVHCSDMNGDGITDVVIQVQGTDGLRVAQASGIWNYPVVWSFETSDNVTQTLVGDFNHDDKPDILNLDNNLMLGLVMVNTQRILVSVDPTALSFDCSNQDVTVQILPDRNGPWELSLGSPGNWQVLATNGQSAVGTIDYDGRSWILEFEVSEIANFGTGMEFRLTIGLPEDEETLTLALGGHCFMAEVGVPQLRWRDQPWPNPFNPRIQGRIQLDAAAEVDAAVFDLAGRRVATLKQGYLSAGIHPLVWDGQHRGQAAAAGLYMLRIRAENSVLSRKIILLK